MNAPSLQVLQKRRLAALQEARALAASVSAEHRVFTDQERDLWLMLDARIEALDVQIGNR
jgi:hypothetical protein